jgi:hypothetical protein
VTRLITEYLSNLRKNKLEMKLNDAEIYYNMALIKVTNQREDEL